MRRALVAFGLVVASSLSAASAFADALPGERTCVFKPLGSACEDDRTGREGTCVAKTCEVKSKYWDAGGDPDAEAPTTVMNCVLCEPTGEAAGDAGPGDSGGGGGDAGPTPLHADPANG